MTREEIFRAALHESGIEYSGPICIDGKLHRIKANGDHSKNSDSVREYLNKRMEAWKMSGPPKAKPRLGGAGLRKLTQTGYDAQPILQGWQHEAARLFREFWRTGNQKHLRAFFTHIVAMRAHDARAAQ